MEDIQEQLANLRRRIARIDLKYKSGASPRPAEAANGGPPRAEDPFLFDPRPAKLFVDEYMSGEVVNTQLGSHFETEKLYERGRRHGSIGICDLNEMPESLLDDISDRTVRACNPCRWAFLDTETTGLAGGAGTVAFLIGVGRITPEGFRVRQFFMRDYGEEPSLLWSLAEHLSQFDVLVTYNGKTYDQPLLETRYRMARSKPPFSRLDHLDLLYGARRLWRLRFETCRLMELENQVLGFEREGDLPSELIPYVYFEYVRTREATRLVPIFHHNAIDIVTLACLTAIVPWAFRTPEEAPLRHGAEWVGLARWLLRAGQEEQALRLMRRGVDSGLKDDLLFRTMWDIAVLEKRLCREDAAIAGFAELAACRNAYRVKALEELAKFYEHRERNYTMALDCTEQALAHGGTEALRRRETRLKQRLARPVNRPLV